MQMQLILILKSSECLPLRTTEYAHPPSTRISSFHSRGRRLIPPPRLQDRITIPPAPYWQNSHQLPHPPHLATKASTRKLPVYLTMPWISGKSRSARTILQYVIVVSLLCDSTLSSLYVLHAIAVYSQCLFYMHIVVIFQPTLAPLPRLSRWLRVYYSFMHAAYWYHSIFYIICNYLQLLTTLSISQNL